MKWTHLRRFPWLDTRAEFVARTPSGGSLLDLGSSDGETLGHIAELRPDLRLFAVDLTGNPEKYPLACEFQRADLERDRLPWPDSSMDAITCMQLVEHLRDLTTLLAETKRLLKPGGKVFFETPHPKTLVLPSLSGAASGAYTFNFYDDVSHIRIVSVGGLAVRLRELGLEVLNTGISRNWLFAASYPFFWCTPPSRRKFTAQTHWLGWSAYLIARRD